MITIENKKTYRGEGIYIGRPSLLGNPFEIGVHGERGNVSGSIAYGCGIASWNRARCTPS
jgi:hypothetical protein